MSNGLDTIVIDEDPQICDQVSGVVKSFYTWGKVYSFSDFDQALKFSLNQDVGLGIFVLSGRFIGRIGFDFLDFLEPQFPLIYEDSIVTTEYASDDLVDMCLAVGIEYLIEKPVKHFELMFSIKSIIRKYIKVATRLS